MSEAETASFPGRDDIEILPGKCPSGGESIRLGSRHRPRWVLNEQRTGFICWGMERLIVGRSYGKKSIMRWRKLCGLWRNYIASRSNLHKMLTKPA